MYVCMYIYIYIYLSDFLKWPLEVIFGSDPSCSDPPSGDSGTLWVSLWVIREGGSGKKVALKLNAAFN